MRMDIKKAIDVLKCVNDLMLFDTLTGEIEPYESLHDLDKDCYDAHLVAIDALKELEQYRQIGTLDECRKARIISQKIIKHITYNIMKMLNKES